MECKVKSRKLKSSVYFTSAEDHTIRVAMDAYPARGTLCKAGRLDGIPLECDNHDSAEFERLARNWLKEFQRSAPAPDEQTQRTRDFERLWRNTNMDSRGALEDGTLSIMSNAKYRMKDGAPDLVTATTITDAELYSRLDEINAQQADPNKGDAQQMAPKI